MGRSRGASPGLARQRRPGVFALVLLVLLVLPEPSRAAVPLGTSYQGLLIDPNGRPLNGPVDLKFTLYAPILVGTPPLPVPTPVWMETHLGVAVTDGAFHVVLGTVIPLAPEILASGALELEVAVNGEALSPRTRLTAVPLAIRSALAETVPDGSITAAKIGELCAVNQILVETVSGWACGDVPEGPAGPEGPQGEPGPTGATGLQGMPGRNGRDGQAGADGVSCWDLDADGLRDPEEDTNADGGVDTLDCRGAGGGTGPSSAFAEFTGPGAHNFIVPSGTGTVVVELWGPGGGGGRSSGVAQQKGGGGGGGGAGGYARALISATPCDTIRMILPAGGAPGADGESSLVTRPDGALLVQVSGGLAGRDGTVPPGGGGVGGIGGRAVLGALIGRTGGSGERGGASVGQSSPDPLGGAGGEPVNGSISPAGSRGGVGARGSIGGRSGSRGGAGYALVAWVANGIGPGSACVDADGDGFTTSGGDCNDADAAIHPLAAEIPDGIDNDCDGSVDNFDPLADVDADGFTIADGDCDDFEPATHPGAIEIPDGADNDCNGVVDDFDPLADVDADGFSIDAGDCNDFDASIHPDAPDGPDGVDNDCDGLIDELDFNFRNTLQEASPDTRVAIAIGGDGLPLLAYLDSRPRFSMPEEDLTLGLIHCDDSACSASTTAVLLSDPNGFAEVPSIGVRTDGTVFIAYQLATERAGSLFHELRLRRCGDPACASSTEVVLDSWGPYRTSSPSLAVGTDGLPILAYVRSASLQHTLNLVHCDDASCSSATTSVVETVATTNPVLEQPVTITIGADGLPIAIYTHSDSGTLKAVHCQDIQCSTFTLETVAPTSFQTSCLTIGSDGLPVLCHPIGAGDLAVVHCSDLTCSSSTTTTVPLPPRPGTLLGESIAVGADGFPVIALGLGGDPGVVHCDDLLCTSHTVTTEVVFTFFGLFFPSIVISDGLPVISYLERTSSFSYGVSTVHCDDVACALP